MKSDGGIKFVVSEDRQLYQGRVGLAQTVKDRCRSLDRLITFPFQPYLEFNLYAELRPSLGPLIMRSFWIKRFNALDTFEGFISNLDAISFC